MPGCASAWAQPSCGSLTLPLADVLNVNACSEGIFLDELTAGLDDITHQFRENFIGFRKIADLDLKAVSYTHLTLPTTPYV